MSCCSPAIPWISDLSIRTFSISYGYSFLHSDKYEVAATIGVNETDISARARVHTATRHVDQTEDQAGPFPTVGLDATYVVQQAVLSRRPRAVHESIASMIWTVRWGFTSSMRCTACVRTFPSRWATACCARTSISAQAKQAGFFNFDSKGPEFFVRVAF